VISALADKRPSLDPLAIELTKLRPRFGTLSSGVIAAPLPLTALGLRPSCGRGFLEGHRGSRS
jgi:hypothetical protein